MSTSTSLGLALALALALIAPVARAQSDAPAPSTADDDLRRRPADDQKALQGRIRDLGADTASSESAGATPAKVAPAPSPGPGTPAGTAPRTPPAHGAVPPAGQEEARAANGPQLSASAPVTPSAAPVERQTPGPDQTRGGTSSAGPWIALVVGAILALAAVVAWIATRPRGEGEGEPLTTPDPELGQAPDSPFAPVRDNDHPLHHCQGHRLGIVIGPDQGAIALAVQYLSQIGCPHILFIKTPTGSAPDTGHVFSVGPSSPGAKAPMAEIKSGKTPAAISGRTAMGDQIDQFFKSCSDCCHWDEVILFAHGGQKYLWWFLLKYLTCLLNDRPVDKFVLWVCESADDFVPHAKKPVDVKAPHADRNVYDKTVFEEIAYLLRPKTCHEAYGRCGCSKDNCNSLDSRQTHGRCPDGRKAVKLYCGAWHDNSTSRESGAHGIISSRLAINDADGWRLTSPNGTMRQIDVAPSGEGESEDGADVTSSLLQGCDDVFAGTPLRADGSINTSATNLSVISPEDRLKSTKTIRPKEDEEPAFYHGGRVCDCPTQEGCQQVA